MKRIVAAFMVVLITSAVAWSQPQYNGQGFGKMHDGAAFAKIHAAKMAYITDRLNLTTQQSYNFIPLYNKYETEIRNTRHDFFKKYRGVNTQNANDATSLQYIDDNLDYQQAVIEIKRKYNNQFLNIISPQQLTELYKAEREFKQMLLKRYLKQQHGGNGGGSRNMHGNGF